MKGLQVAVYGIALPWIAAAGILCSRRSEDKAGMANHNLPAAKVVHVDDLVEHPDDFTGLVEVTGTVKEIDAANAAFTLSCEDACIFIPVTLPGNLPAVGNEVTVVGKVVKGKGDKYIFAAQDISTK